jgi:HK97 family phage portal protein
MERPAERRFFADSAFPTSIDPSNVDGHWSDTGDWVTERTALQLIAVQACVRILADSIASLPLDVFRKVGGTRTEVTPTPPLILQPYAKLTAFEWKMQAVTSLALRGNSYHLIVERDRLEYPTQAIPIHPDYVRVQFNYDTYQVTYWIHGELVPTADIIHIRRFTLPGSPVGLSPINAARQGIGLGLAAERYGARYFGDSANPSSVLETDQELSPEAARYAQQQWLSSHGGHRHPAMLSGGLKWRPIQITPNESQFLETRKFQRSEIAMLYGIPPQMIGDTEKYTSWGTGIEQQSIGFVTYTLRPWLTCIESVLSNLLPRGQYAQFNVGALLRGDQKARYEAYLQARNAGWMNVNEIRELEDRPPVPNGDDFLQPLNYGPLGSDPLAAGPAPASTSPKTPEAGPDPIT